MDQQQQQEQLRDKVFAAMEAGDLSATRAAKLAGISPVTMTKITHAQPVSPGTVGKIRAAFGIPAPGDTQADEGYSPTIEAVRDVVDLILRDVPEAELPARVSRIMAAACGS